MRWSLRLAKFDFIVQHKPGTKIGHVDALSRHVGAVMEDGPPSRERFLEEQGKDSYCSTLRPGNYTSKADYFFDDDGVVYKRQINHKHQLVVSASLIQDVIRANHTPMYVAHLGIRRTFELISLNYWWPVMRKSIEDYVRKCDPCQRRKEAREYTAPLGNVEEPTAPFQVTSMDITGPYLMTPRKNKYLLTFICHFSKFVEAYPIPDQSAETCARIYSSQIITRHGTGSTLITDQGRSFVSSFLKKRVKYWEFGR